MSVLANASVKHRAIGRIVVPPNVPPGFTLFYTTIDFDGRIDERLLGIVGTLVTCRQVHGTTIIRASREPRGADRESECDALWTDAKHTALGIKVADCLPVSIIDPKNSIIANIHSGWRGTVQNITASTLDALPLDTSQSFAFLGPSIRVCCFEVGEEVAAQFDVQFVARTRGPKPHVDVIAVTKTILRQRGFAEERIIDTELCTRCVGSIFHSYRRDKRTGRNLAIVAQ